MKNYDDFFKNNGYVFLNCGLIHNVYEKDNYVYKIVKCGLNSMNTNHHFFKEKKCMNFLKNKGFDVAKIIAIYKKGEFLEKYSVLKEKKIEGICFDDQKISNDNIIKILKFIQKVSKISLRKYGVIFDKDVKANNSWKEYIIEQISVAHTIIKNYFNNDSFMNEQIDKIDYIYLNKVESKFLIMDPNTENFIFTKDKIIAIDIDHPIGGDPLWQSACIYWYKPNWKRNLEELNYYNKENYEMMLKYCIIFGLNTFNFHKVNKIEIESWNFDRINSLIMELKDERKNNNGENHW